MNEPWPPDPLLDEVDEARRRLLAEFDNDPRKVMEYYIQQQEQYADRLVNYGTPEKKDQPAA